MGDRSSSVPWDCWLLSFCPLGLRLIQLQEGTTHASLDQRLSCVYFGSVKSYRPTGAVAIFLYPTHWFSLRMFMQGKITCTLSYIKRDPMHVLIGCAKKQLQIAVRIAVSVLLVLSMSGYSMIDSSRVW